MRRVGTLVIMTAFGFLAAGGLFGDDRTPTKLKGRLPPNWSKLGLSDDQKQDLYTVRSQYQAKIADLEKQVRTLRKEERAAMYKVLTPGQKSRLKEIVAEKAGGSEPEPEPKPPDKKPRVKPNPTKQ